MHALECPHILPEELTLDEQNQAQSLAVVSRENYAMTLPHQATADDGLMGAGDTGPETFTL